MLSKLRTEQNMTIFLTSHDVGDIEAVCDRTIIVNHGKIVVDEPTSELRRLINKERRIRLTGIDAPTIDMPGVTSSSGNGSHVLHVDTKTTDITTILKIILDRGIPEKLKSSHRHSKMYLWEYTKSNTMYRSLYYICTVAKNTTDQNKKVIIQMVNHVIFLIFNVVLYTHVYKLIPTLQENPFQNAIWSMSIYFIIFALRN